MAAGMDSVIERAERLPADLLRGLIADVRTWTSIELDFDLFFKADVDRNDSNPSVNRNVISNIETELFRTLRNISREMQRNGKRVLESKKAGLDRKSHLEILPWLPWPGSVIAFQPTDIADSLASQFDLTKPLAGQRHDDLGIYLGQISVVRFVLPKFQMRVTPGKYMGLQRYWWRNLKITQPLAVVPIATYELVFLEFETGSLWPTAKVRKKILAGAMAILGLGFISERIGVAIEDHDKDVKFEQKLKTAATGPAVFYCGVDLSLDKLKGLRPGALDYNAPGISAQEKCVRIAEEQAGLNMAMGFDLMVDGKLGRKTLEAERAFGEENKVKGTNADPRFRAKLAQVFIPPSEK